MLKLIVIALTALSLTACITFEIPAPEYPELSDVSDSDRISDSVPPTTTGSKPQDSTPERSTPHPADTARPAATVHPAKMRPDTSQIVVISNSSRLDSRGMMNVFEENVHLAEKVFNDKWIWFVEESVERVERNRLRLYTGSDDRLLYARFPSGAGLEDVVGQVELLCFGPTSTERSEIMTLTVSDCEIVGNPLDPDGRED